MSEMLLISVRPHLRTSVETSRTACSVAFDFNVAISPAKIKGDLRNILPFVEAVLQRQGGEILEDGKNFSGHDEAATRFSARILIRSTRAAIDELVLNPLVEECGVLDPRNRIEKETFLLDRKTNRAAGFSSPEKKAQFMFAQAAVILNKQQGPQAE
jgi:hypothetical protein